MSLRKQVQDFLRQAELKPRRRWGQNFMVEPVFWEKIIAAAAPTKDDAILEIGPGPGFLSAVLAPRVKKYVAVEIDPILAAQARTVLSGLGNAEVIRDDILECDWDGILPKKPKKAAGGPRPGRRLVISNLPYSISSPVIAKLAEERRLFDLAVLTLQKEVADRLTCGPGSSDYGALTVFAGYHFDIKKLFLIPAGAFYPPPEVGSAVIEIRPKKKPPVRLAAKPELFFRFVQMAYSQRRKQLGNSLRFALASVGQKKVLLEDILAGLEIAASRRIEELSLNQLADIFNQALKTKRND